MESLICVTIQLAEILAFYDCAKQFYWSSKLESENVQKFKLISNLHRISSKFVVFVAPLDDIDDDKTVLRRSGKHCWQQLQKACTWFKEHVKVLGEDESEEPTAAPEIQE